MKIRYILGLMAGLIVLAGCQPAARPEAVTPEPNTEADHQATVPMGKDPKNASYMVDGRVITLTNGKAETPAAPGSASMITTTIFGEPTKGELTGDAAADAAVMLVQEGSGSGTFFYQAAALNKNEQYQGTNAILLGDRIAPQGTPQISDGTIMTSFAQRASGEPMTAQPSVMVSKYFEVAGETLKEIPNPNQPQGQM